MLCALQCVRADSEVVDTDHDDDALIIGRNSGIANFISETNNNLYQFDDHLDTYAEVSAKGVSITMQKTRIDHYRGFFFYYCIENYDTPLTEIPEKVFEDNFRLSVIA